MEKEAIAKGVPVGEAIDIEIPPPRPKRKPNSPYPRKSGYVSSSNAPRVKDSKEVCFSSSHTHIAEQVLDLEKEPLCEACYIPSFYIIVWLLYLDVLLSIVLFISDIYWQ